jgi:hypothetical protein
MQSLLWNHDNKYDYDINTFDYTRSVPKVMRMIFFFAQRRRARKGKWGVKAGGGGTQVYSLTFLS